MSHWRYPRRTGPTFLGHADNIRRTELANFGHPFVNSVQIAVEGSFRTTLKFGTSFFVYSNGIVFSIFTTFLFPLWTLSFATDALGRDREAGNLLWLLTRPLPRWSIYLGTFLATLPWCLILNLGGFAILCLLAGSPGKLALKVYWPAILLGTLAFASLFHFFGSWLRRAAVVAILYVFFLETIMGNLPGHLKRLSVSFYVRCLMFARAHEFGMEPERPEFYLPVSGSTALAVLTGVLLSFLGLGLWRFSNREYLDGN
jgi:ABC-type transport system involved in multi-copper enzyme maturation permease subunit